MTDEEMDARLHAAGSAWRSANAVATAPRPVTTQPPMTSTTSTTSTNAARGPRRRSLLIASAAVVIAALVAAGLLAWRGGSDKPNTDVGPAALLRGTVWQLLDGPAGTNSTATLSIDGAGHLVADDTCQVIGGSVRVAGDRLTISSQVVRYYSCTDSVGETTFTPHLKILRGKVSYRISGKTLTINRSGAATMRLRATNTPAPSLDVPTFFGANWRLVRATDENRHPVKVTQAASLRIDDRGRLRAGDGCNTLTATVRGDPDRIRITGVVNTELPCPYIPMLTVVDGVLDGAIDQIVNNGYLTITKPGVGELVYRWNPDSAATDPARLTGATWRLTAVAGTRATGSATVRIGSDGRISGSDGCRTIGGTAQLRHGTAILRVTYGSPTPCPKAVADQASTIDSFLGARQVVWAIRDGVLVVYGGGAQSYALRYRR